MVLNAETGELEKVLNAREIGRRRREHPYHQPGRFAWYTVSSDEYGAAVRSLRGAALHVFAALPLLMVKDNMILCRQKEICEATGLSAPAVSRAMVEMRKQLLIGEVDTVLRFSPEIAWKGYATDLSWVLNRWLEQKAGWIKERKTKVRGTSGTAEGGRL